jgi:hypothetical protein
MKTLTIRGNKYVLLSLVAIAGVCIVVLMRGSNRDCSIFELAQPIHTKPIWSLESYAWIRNDELIDLGYERKDQSVSLHSTKFDMSTGKSKVSSMVRVRVEGDHWDFISCSPNGKWTLWFSNSGVGGKWALIKTDGEKVIYRKHKEADIQPGSVTVCWKPDSRGWVELTSRSAFVETSHYTLDSETVSSNRIPELDSLNKRPGFHLTLLGTTRLSELVISELPGYSVATSTVYYVSMPPQSYCFRKTHLSDPPNSVIDAIALSPDGTRLAWLAYSEPRSGIYRLLSTILPFANLRQSAQISLWETNRVDQKARQLGFNDVLPSLDRWGSDFPTCLQWLPDNKCVGFVRNHKIYVLSTL